jgi:hypothetical protein
MNPFKWLWLKYVNWLFLEYGEKQWQPTSKSRTIITKRLRRGQVGIKKV